MSVVRFSDKLQEDVEAQRLVTSSPDLEQLFARASELSKLYTAKTLARSPDLLDVAAAHVTSCARVASGDDRQLAVAKASGLEVVDINRRARRSALS